MFRRFTTAAFLAGLIGMAGSTAYAESSETLHVSVPFDFKVGIEVLPAGRYEVSYDPLSPGVLLVRSEDGRRVGVALTQNTTTGKPRNDAILVFDRQGSEYTLAKVFGPSERTGLELLGTRDTAD